MIYYILWVLNYIIVKLAFNPIIIGKENIPKKNGAVIAADHSDQSDPIFISSATKRRLYYLANYDILYPKKDKPFYHRFAFLARWTKQVPIIKNQGRSQEAIDKAVNLVKRGKLFVIFPEGTIDGGETIIKPRRGVARIALKARAPIIPIGIINTAGTLPKGKIFFQKYPKVKINIGKPLYYRKYYGKHNDKKITKSIANDVMRHIKKLCEEAEKL